jgi:hypothetical protein
VAHIDRVCPQLRLHKPLPGYRHTHVTTNLGFTSRYLHRHHSLLHLERRRALENGRAGLRNHSPLRSSTREGELGFWKSLRSTAQVLHHGSPSFQIGRCCLPPPTSLSTSIGLLQHCHQQCHHCDYICKRMVHVKCFYFRCSSCSVSTCLAIACFRSSCCLVHLVYLNYMW